MTPRLRRLTQLSLLTLSTALVATLTVPDEAEAFCGFYVAGADAELFANATMVVMMREGKRTVLSMQNDYQGPPEDFALVIPVPVVLEEDNVKTLPPEIFDRVDKLAAPRLVEYWEQDPCSPLPPPMAARGAGGAMPEAEVLEEEESDLGVTIEAQFTVAEYEVVILSAEDSTGLDTWLRQEQYNIPAGAEPLLKPYVEGGMKFFVAKVDSQKVKFDSQGKARLSPLRFHYDSEEFSLPIRLGLINADGPQDLLVHILAPGKRYETANYPNVTIPTNLEVKNEVRERFGEFYVSLFDHTLAGRTPAPVVTEYAWSAGSCDPCPEQPLDDAEIATLGGDVLPRQASAHEFVLTRLHARYDRDSLGEDLVFKQAPAIVGGRERRVDGGWAGGPDKPGKEGEVPRPKLEQGATPAAEYEQDNFQARYIIRHEWTGPIECQDPMRGHWGAKPQGGGQDEPAVARDLAYAKRGGSLGTFVSTASAAQLGLAATPEPAAKPTDEPDGSSGEDKPAEPGSSGEDKPAEPGSSGEDKPKGCACSSDSDADERAPFGLALLALLFGLRRRTRARLFVPET